MNHHPFPRTTMAAEGLPRRPFTVAELERMVAAGILAEDERIELIGGEVVPMSPKGDHHEMLRAALSHSWIRRLPPDLMVAQVTTFRLDADSYLEPDFVFYPRGGGLRGLTPESARLVVEIADSSLAYDLGLKASVYARFGIVELWVLNAVTLQARIHRDPTPTGYRTIADLPPTSRLEPLAGTALSVTLADLDLR